MKKLLLAVFAGCSLLASAQHSHPTHRHAPLNVILGEVEDTVGIMQAFIENSPADYKVPDAPRFAIVGKNEKFYLGFGGYVKGTMSFDWGSPINNYNEFIVSQIPMPGSSSYPFKPGNKGQFGISAQQSDIYLNMVALPKEKNKVGFYLNFIFLGNGYLPQVRQAYVSWRGIEMGYGFSLFTDLAADPSTIDYEGPNSFTVVINAKFDYRHNFGKHFGIGIGAELPMASYTNGKGTDPRVTGGVLRTIGTATVDQRIPDIPMYVQWNFGNNNRIRLSGLLRNMQYRGMMDEYGGSLVGGKTKNLVGGGVQLSGNFNIANKLIGYYQATVGKGMTSYFEDVTGMGYDMVPCATDPGKLQTVKAWGGYLGLQYNWSSKVYSNLIYSHLRLYTPNYGDGSFDGSAYNFPQQYKYGQYAVANVFYNISNTFSWALEYIYGRRMDWNHVQAHDNRIQTMLQVTF
ncbi:MAG: hypothetical protein J1D77_01990 [Muribaculaceae bacterium]|nr:hypothetical protein [Muribaculaceae bacterium]